MKKIFKTVILTVMLMMSITSFSSAMDFDYSMSNENFDEEIFQSGLSGERSLESEGFENAVDIIKTLIQGGLIRIFPIANRIEIIRELWEIFGRDDSRKFYVTILTILNTNIAGDGLYWSEVYIIGAEKMVAKISFSWGTYDEFSLY